MRRVERLKHAARNRFSWGRGFRRRSFWSDGGFTGLLATVPSTRRFPPRIPVRYPGKKDIDRVQKTHIRGWGCSTAPSAGTNRTRAATRPRVLGCVTFTTVSQITGSSRARHLCPRSNRCHCPGMACRKAEFLFEGQVGLRKSHYESNEEQYEVKSEASSQRHSEVQGV